MRDLVADLVADAVEHSVPVTVRETVNAVARLARDSGQLDPTVSIRDLVAELRLDRTAVQRRVRGAINRGLLANQEERKGHPAALVLDQPLPDDLAILPSWETFAEADCGGGVHVCTRSRAESAGPSVGAVRNRLGNPIPPQNTCTHAHPSEHEAPAEAPTLPGGVQEGCARPPEEGQIEWWAA